MRVIAGYTPEAPARRTRLRVTVSDGITSIDLTALYIVEAASVTDSARREASSATVELQRREEAWNDPIGDASSPLSLGNRLLIEMGEEGGVLTAIFEGEITDCGTGAESPGARTTLQAMSGREQWWNLPRTSPLYTTEETDAIVVDLFERYGGLTAPADFDLPGISRVIGRLQGMEKPIMATALDLYEPSDLMPWWDPVSLKLSTLDLSVPGVPDLVLSDAVRGSIELDVRPPEATRVKLAGGTKHNVVRLEIGEWTTPANYLPGANRRQAGVEWARGGKADWHLPPFYARIADDDPLWRWWGVWELAAHPPQDWLWVIYQSEWDTDGTGYRGPEGVEFAVNDPGISTDAVSHAELVPEGWGAGVVDITTFVTQERFGATENRQIAWVKLRVDPADIPGGPAGKTAEQLWQLVLDSDDVLGWIVKGRQVDRTTLHQYTAQAWDNNLIARFGDRSFDAENQTLYVAAAPYTAAELEAKRLMERMRWTQYPASVELEGQDLRLLPGDTIQTRHPRQAILCTIWSERVTQAWRGDKATTSVEGYVVETAAP